MAGRLKEEEGSGEPVRRLGAGVPQGRRDEEREAQLARRGKEKGHKPGRKAGAVVVLVAGRLVLYVEKGGRSLLSFTEDEDELRPAVDALALTIREGGLGRLTVEKADGETIFDTPLARVLESAGFRSSLKGLRLRA